MLAVLGSATGCSVSEWDTSEIDRPTTTEAVTYTRDEAGITASLVDHLARPTANLNEWSPSEDQARCVAERLLRRISPERLFEAGFDPAEGSLALELSDEERAAVVNVLVGCVDYDAAVLELLSAYGKVPLRVAACVSRGVERLGLDRRLAEGLVEGAEPDALAGDGQLASGLATLAVECTQPEDLLPNAPLPVQPQTDISDASGTRRSSETTTADDPAEDGAEDATTSGGTAPEDALDLGGGRDGTGSDGP